MPKGKLKQWEEYKLEIEARLKADPMLVYGQIKQVTRAESNEDGWMTGLCPFHRDTNPSFAFNTVHLGWCCFAGCGKGDVWAFIMHTSGQSFKEAIVTLGDELGIPRPAGSEWVNRPAIDDETIDLFVKQLWASDNQSLLPYLQEKRGLADDTIRARRIGWSQQRNRYTIPVIDENGKCWNIRLHSPTAKQKMNNFYTKTHKYGKPPMLYGVDLLAKEKDSLVLLCEGELDAILATQAGITAVTSTHGCRIFLEEWIEYFKGRDVAVCYDCDEEGHQAVTNLILPMFRPYVQAGTVKSLKIVTLPLAGTKADKDITDWFVKHGCEPTQFKALVYDTPLYEFPPEDEPLKRDEFERLNKIAQEPPIPINSFTEIDRTDLTGRRVVCDITVCGETSESFKAVEQFKVTFCPDRNAGKCSLCTGPVTIPHGARDFIGSCLSSDAQVTAMLARNYCPRGQRPAIEILKKRTVREFFCHQRVNRVTNVAAPPAQPAGRGAAQPANDDEQVIAAITAKRGTIAKTPATGNELNRMWNSGRNEELVEKRVYYLSDEFVRPGHYRAEGWAIDRPQSQHSSFLIEKLEPQEDDYESFRTAEHLDELHAITSLTATEIVDDIRDNVTRVYERDELHLGVLLTYLSPRFFDFNGERLRGWICSAIIGDVGTAKTKTFTNIAQWVGVGDVFSGLTGSRTGLAYALHQSQKGWNARLGRYPANSRKLLMVDEVQTLPHDDLKSITKAMDEGIMQVDRVESKSYESQTRVIFVGNPKAPIMDEYRFGCQALRPVFPIMMIRRLDFVILANQLDVKDVGRLLNKMHTASTSQRVTVSMLRSLIFLMWNITPDAIVFQPNAIEACMESATRLTQKYGYASGVPLITQYEINKKVARISVAMAALNGSFDASFTVLTIRPEHVVMVESFLDAVYSAENFDLSSYSARMRSHEEVDDYDQIADQIDRIGESEKHSPKGENGHLKRMLYTIYSMGIEVDGHEHKQPSMSRSDVIEATGLSKEYITKKMRTLKAFNLVASGRSGYRSTPKFSRFFRRFLRERPGYFNGAVDDDMIADVGAPDDN